MSRSLPDASRGRVGFTLLEILIALMISGFLVTSIFRVLSGNGRFVALQSAREEVQQNARAALDLIAGDLRAVPPGGILEMEPEAIRFLQPRAWAVLCNTLDPSSSAAWVILPAALLPDDDLFQSSHRGLAIEQTDDPLRRTGDYHHVAAPLRETAGNPCVDIQPFPSADHATLGFGTPGPPFVTGDSVPAGTPVMLYEEVRYDVTAGSGAAPDRWIRRMAGYGASGPNMQPIAGPVPQGSGLSFTYFGEDGTTPASTAAEVRRIGIEVVVRSHSTIHDAAGARPQQVDSARTEVHLRNVVGGAP